MIATKKTSEKTIETKVCQYARDRGIGVYKFVSPNRRSVPDRVLFFPGNRTAFMEFKAPGKRPTAGQEREISRLNALGFPVAIVDDVAFGKEVIDIWEKAFE